MIGDPKLETTLVPSLFGIPELLGEVEMEITLSKSPPAKVYGSLPFITAITNQGSLKDEAFQTKSFTVRIERGNFKLPCEIGQPPKKPPTPRSDMRLLFDPSPYPPENEWWPDPPHRLPGDPRYREPRAGVEELGPFPLATLRYREFIGREVEGLGGRAMNESLFSGCTML
jgi:hypothetical protein